MTEFNIAYLNNLIENKVEENLNLDYKASGALDKQNNKTSEISKDVSAMANSDGGILIYGISEDKINKHLPEKIDPINRKEFSKEWLEQIIQDKIRPRISNFKIYPININDEQVVYIVEIIKSNTAHQAFDKKYYKRFNFQSTAMYDYEIRDILNRSKNPEITLDFKLRDQRTKLIIRALNKGSVYAKYLNIKIKIPKNAVSETHFNSFDEHHFELFCDNTVRDILDIEFTGMNANTKYGPSRYEPILPTQTFELKELMLANDAFNYHNILSWEIFCDNAQPMRGEIKFQDIITNRESHT